MAFSFKDFASKALGALAPTRKPLQTASRFARAVPGALKPTIFSSRDFDKPKPKQQDFQPGPPQEPTRHRVTPETVRFGDTELRQPKERKASFKSPGGLREAKDFMEFTQSPIRKLAESFLFAKETGRPTSEVSMEESAPEKKSMTNAVLDFTTKQIAKPTKRVVAPVLEAAASATSDYLGKQRDLYAKSVDDHGVIGGTLEQAVGLAKETGKGALKGAFKIGTGAGELGAKSMAGLARDFDFKGTENYFNKIDKDYDTLQDLVLKPESFDPNVPVKNLLTRDKDVAFGAAAEFVGETLIPYAKAEAIAVRAFGNVAKQFPKLTALTAAATSGVGVSGLIGVADNEDAETTKMNMMFDVIAAPLSMFGAKKLVQQFDQLAPEAKKRVLKQAEEVMESGKRIKADFIDDILEQEGIISERRAAKLMGGEVRKLQPGDISEAAGKKVAEEGPLESPKVSRLIEKSEEAFATMTKKQKQEAIKTVENNIESHIKGVETIGAGLDKEAVEAGEIFLRKNAPDSAVLKRFEDIGAPKTAREFEQAKKVVPKEPVGVGKLAAKKPKAIKKAEGLEAAPRLGEQKGGKELAISKSIERDMGEDFAREFGFSKSNIKKNAQRASSFTLKDPDKAMRIAHGLESSGEDALDVSIAIGLKNKAKLAGDTELFKDLTISNARRLRGYAQALNAQKMSVKGTSSEIFMKQIVDKRLAELNIPKDFRKSVGEAASPEVYIKSKAKELKEVVKTTKRGRLDLKQVDDLLKNLICK